jgi:hypothetical protein
MMLYIVALLSNWIKYAFLSTQFTLAVENTAFCGPTATQLALVEIQSEGHNTFVGAAVGAVELGVGVGLA